MAFFMYGFSCAVLIFTILVYAGAKLNNDKLVDRPQRLSDKFVIKYYKGDETFCSWMLIDKYDKVIKGPMADDIYHWLTGKKVDDDA